MADEVREMWEQILGKPEPGAKRLFPRSRLVPESAIVKGPRRKRSLSRRIGLVDINPHDVGSVPPPQLGGHTGKGWHGPRPDSSAPRGEPTIYHVGDLSAPRGGNKFGDPYSVGGGSRIGPRGRFVGHGPRPEAVQIKR